MWLFTLSETHYINNVNNYCFYHFDLLFYKQERLGLTMTTQTMTLISQLGNWSFYYYYN